MNDTIATTKESHAAAPPQHPAAAATGKKRPASPAATKAQQEPRPLHDDALPPDVVEEGKIYFFYKPRVMASPKQKSDGGGASSASAAATTGHVSSLDDVQRTFMLLSPLAVSDRNVGEGRKALAEAEAHDPQHGRPLLRIFVIPKKALPGSSAGQPRLAICVATAESAGELTKGLEASTYTTKTRGERLQPPARVVARGYYVIVGPTAGPVARAAHHAQQKHGEAADEEDDEQQPKNKAPKAHARQTPAEKLAAAAASGRHGRPVRSARLLWLLDAPAHGPAQEMISLQHRGAFVIKVKGPHGSAGGGGGGGWAPPPPKADELPEVARARLTAGKTQWIECDTHAALDFKGAQMLMVAQYTRGGMTGPGALEEGDVKQDREAMAAEAGPEVAAELADLVAEDERRLMDDAKQHHEQRARGGGGGLGLGGAIRRALLAELAPPHEEQEEEDWAAQHHEEAEAQLRAHEAQEKEEEEEGGAAQEQGRLVVDPAITGEIE